MILTIANIKGGSTRTTTAMFLACAYTRMGYQVTVIDTDYRQNATSWARDAREEDDRLPFRVISRPFTARELRTNPAQVKQLTRFDAPGAVTILDTASATPEIVPATLRISDFVLVPFATSPVDYHPTIDTLRSLIAPYAVVMTEVDRRTRDEAQLRRRFQEDEVPVLETTIPYRAAFHRAHGTTPGGDLHGYMELARELRTMMNLVDERGAKQLWMRG